MVGKCEVCELQAENVRLRYEIDAIPAIKEERNALAAEVLEQCRIIAMGAEREDALAAELTRLKASIALNKMAENARELGLSYDNAPKPWFGLTDDDIEQGHKESWVDKQAFESSVWWAEKKLKDKNI
jgi:hypothetical protein